MTNATENKIEVINRETNDPVYLSGITADDLAAADDGNGFIDVAEWDDGTVSVHHYSEESTIRMMTGLVRYWTGYTLEEEDD